jgi:hypothetical protein
LKITVKNVQNSNSTGGKPGEQMLKILRSKLKEERVQIDVPADALNQWPVNNTLRKTADRQDPAHY